MADDHLEPGELAELRDPEIRVLPSERSSRRMKRRIVAALVAAILAHVVLLSGCVGLVILLLPFDLLPDPPPDRESMAVFIHQPPRPRPADTPPQTNQIAEVDARAESEGPAEPQPAGDAIPRQPGVAEPSREERRPEPSQPKAPEPDVRPAEAETPRDPMDARRRLSEALRGIGGSGEWGSLAQQGEGRGSSGLGYEFGGAGYQIESTADVDWGPWGRRMHSIVKGNWYDIMPVAARVGMKGIVRVRFAVHRDGALTDWEMLDSSGLVPLDEAVRAALVDMSDPLPPLPLREFDEDPIHITFTFIYNLADEREMRAWERQRWMEKKRAGG